MLTLAPEGWCVESIRKAKGISLEEISNETKIKITTLRAIEAGNFAELPGGIYAVSYIRQFARAIGANEANLVQFYPGHAFISGTPDRVPRIAMR